MPGLRHPLRGCASCFGQQLAKCAAVTAGNVLRARVPAVANDQVAADADIAHQVAVAGKDETIMQVAGVRAYERGRIRVQRDRIGVLPDLPRGLPPAGNGMRQQ